MLRLNLKKEPYWLDLPSKVRIRVRPLSTAIMNAAQSNVIKQIKAIQAEEAGEMRPNLQDEAIRLGLSEALLVKALAIVAILEWDGVMNQAGDAPAEINEQNICELMDVWFIGQDFWKKYATSLFEVEVEGNESRPGVSGTSAAGLPTAPAASRKNSHAAKEEVTQ